MMILAAIGGLISLLCTILILIHAFQNSLGMGFLCLCVPCFIIYYMFAVFQHENKTAIIAGYFLGFALNGAVQQRAFMQEMRMQQQMQQVEQGQ